MLVEDFVAGENITANQIVMLSGVADNTVLVGTGASLSNVCGVALNNALITEIVRVCIFGVVEIIVGENVAPGDKISLGAVAGRGYKCGTILVSTGSAHNHGNTGAGSAHSHAINLTSGIPSATIAVLIGDADSTREFAAHTSGGSPTVEFDAFYSTSAEQMPTNTHTHDITDPTADESSHNHATVNEASHTHSLTTGQILGKMLESTLLGASGRCLVTLG